MDSASQNKIEAGHRKLFLEKLEPLLEKCDILSKERYDHIKYVLENNGSFNDKPKDMYNIIKQYVLISIGGQTIIARKNKDFENALGSDGEVHIEYVKRLCFVGEVFDIIQKAHLNTGHSAGKKTHQELGKKVSNISRDVCVLYCSLCT